MAERITLPHTAGALLPAEERLQNVLKAIEDRIKEERYALGDDTDSWRRAYISGLDIAWSLAQTETLRRG
jgi:hypothetical protein